MATVMTARWEGAYNAELAENSEGAQYVELNITAVHEIIHGDSRSNQDRERHSRPMIDPHSILLISSALVAIVGIILLVAIVKLNPFLALFVVSLALAMAAGMPFSAGIHSFEVGMGATLGHIAVIVALGTMLGKMLAESGGAEQIALTIIGFFGEKRIAWAMMVIGLVVGLPCFFEVGFVLLIPIAYTVSRRTGKSLLLVALPLVAGLSVAQGLVPPHPAAMLAVTIFNADVGRTIFYALLIGIPTAIIAGPVYATWISPRIQLSAEESDGRRICRSPSRAQFAGIWADDFHRAAACVSHADWQHGGSGFGKQRKARRSAAPRRQ